MKRFWDKVSKTKDGCWLWTAARHIFGYGIFSLDGKDFGAHRLSWEFLKGPIPKGMHVLHKCDVPSCVNPDHLFLGTHQDNMYDRTKKFRYAHGTRHGMAKLTDEQALEIKADPRKQRTIAADYGVSQTTVWWIKSGRHWAHAQRSIDQRQALKDAKDDMSKAPNETTRRAIEQLERSIRQRQDRLDKATGGK